MQNYDNSRELVLLDTFKNLIEMTRRFAEVDTLMESVFKQISSLFDFPVFELSLSEVHFLAAVAESAPVNGVQLTRILGLTKGGVSKMATRLVTKGMIETGKSEQNRKSQYYSLTDQGGQVCKIHGILHEAVKNQILKSVSPYSIDELSLFNRILTDISKEIEKSSSDIRSNYREYLDKTDFKMT
jgi:DNA-binding MarR family transcriptional regulator